MIIRVSVHKYHKHDKWSHFLFKHNDLKILNIKELYVIKDVYTSLPKKLAS